VFTCLWNEFTVKVLLIVSACVPGFLKRVSSLARRILWAVSEAVSWRYLLDNLV
jgi:hypothetical protein